MTKVLNGRTLSKSALRPQVSNLQRLFKCEAGRHNFTKNMHDTGGIKRTSIALKNALQYLSLALRSVIHHLGLGLTAFVGRCRLAHFDLGDTLCALGPAINQRLNVLVNGVYICPDLV